MVEECCRKGEIIKRARTVQIEYVIFHRLNNKKVEERGEENRGKRMEG
jgi:hypothetical protein